MAKVSRRDSKFDAYKIMGRSQFADVEAGGGGVGALTKMGATPRPLVTRSRSDVLGDPGGCRAGCHSVAVCWVQCWETPSAATQYATPSMPCPECLAECTSAAALVTAAHTAPRSMPSVLSRPRARDVEKPALSFTPFCSRLCASPFGLCVIH
jgi:hypothetical protein